jgi:hypothetical protein
MKPNGLIKSRRKREYFYKRKVLMKVENVS